MKKEEVLAYYSNEKLQEILWKFAKNREVVARNKEGFYFSRPGILLYPKDIIKQIESGAFSFHCSVELWKNPLLINEKNYDEQRIGFDWVIDIDSKLGLEEAKIAAKLVKSFLDKYKLGYFAKFSGRRGFHFIVFWENFPEEINYRKITSLYPELPKVLSNFLREKIKDELLEELIKYKGSVKELTKEQAVEELWKGDVGQATEKVWVAAALAVKAYAEWKERRRLTSHGELWEYMRRMVKEPELWVREV